MLLNRIEIYEPKYSTKTVLVNPRKVEAHNIIYFTKGTYKGQEYYISGQVIKSYPLVSNGSIQCYDVPMNELEPLATPENKQTKLGGSNG